ncbi:FAD-binding oxidoreductase [Streptomyces sp. NPDC018031]|uniref:FAD-binding oxidoreductase n=1 Tax=Streptomyces sp. NPDC018031 TaxID=3365033 RepID=UPI0037AF1AF7
MPGLSRRQLFRDATLATSGVVAGLALESPALAAPAAGTTTDCALPLGPVTARPDDPRYPYLVQRGAKRWSGTPDYVRVVGSTQHVVQAVQEAVDAGKRIAVRSGGHCAEGWVDDPAVRVVIDLSGMTEVSFDPARNAFAVEAGATLGEVYRRLFLGWGVTVPAGWCPGVGAGGHIAGGGYGVLSRSMGLVVDHLYAVEVVVVDKAGRATAVVATRDAADPHRDLWWAHTGGGGGNFGVVTRYWLRKPGGTGSDPGALLPRAPGSAITFSCHWPWQALALDEAKFTRLIRNHTDWCERNSAPGTPATRLYADLTVGRKANDLNITSGQVYGADADRLLDDYLAALGAGVGTPVNVVRTHRPWLAAALNGPAANDFRLKIKSAYLRTGFTDGQLATIHRHLTREQDPGLLFGSVGIAGYGGQISAVAADATAFPHRDAVMRIQYTAAWADPELDTRYVDWLRALYRDLYADTGGVPAPEDGAYINYPDDDLADPDVNTSGVPWSTLYYKGNYPRLQKIKARWDPRNVFHHTLGIALPS